MRRTSAPTSAPVAIARSASRTSESWALSVTAGVCQPWQPWGYSCLTMSTEISTAGTAPLFSSQWVVFLSSGQPTPGP